MTVQVLLKGITEHLKDLLHTCSLKKELNTGNYASTATGHGMTTQRILQSCSGDHLRAIKHQILAIRLA